MRYLDKVTNLGFKMPFSLLPGMWYNNQIWIISKIICTDNERRNEKAEMCCTYAFTSLHTMYLFCFFRAFSLLPIFANKVSTV